MTTVHLELLLGRRVHDANGRVAGRIFEILAIRRGGLCFIDAYLLGRAGLLARLGISTAGLIGWRLHREPKRVPWQLMDLSDPQHPRLKVGIDELPAGKSGQVD